MSIIKTKKRNTLFKDENGIISLPEINREEITVFLSEIFKNLSLDEFVGLLTNELIESFQYIDLCKGNKAGQKTSLLFNPHRLDTKASKTPIPIYESLNDLSFISGLARVLLFVGKGKITPEVLYQSLGVGIEGRAYIGEFPPHLARDLYLKYGIINNTKILDPCGGWGGRMLGASVISDYYECFEPSTKTANGLNKLQKFICRFRPSFKTVINIIPFEDSELKSNYYDIALTSPPYYDTEIYSDEETNSCNRYNSFDEWIDGFFKPLITKTINALKPDAPFILNIGSRVYPINNVLKEYCKEKKYSRESLGNHLSGTGGLGRIREGEHFYLIKRK